MFSITCIIHFCGVIYWWKTYVRHCKNPIPLSAHGERHVFKSERLPIMCSEQVSRYTSTPLQLSPESGQLGFVTMDILGPLPKTLNGNQFLLVVTDRCSKLARSVHTSETAASHTASLFMGNWIIPYDIATQVLTYSGWSLSVGFLSCYAPSLERNTWRLQRTAGKRITRQKGLTRQVSPDNNTMKKTTSRTGTLIGSHWRKFITPKCTALQIWRLLAWWFRNIPSFDHIWLPDVVNHWRHSNHISPPTTSTIAPPHNDNAKRRQQENGDGATTLQMWPQREDSQCTSDVVHQTVRVY